MTRPDNLVALHHQMTGSYVVDASPLEQKPLDKWAVRLILNQKERIEQLEAMLQDARQELVRAQNGEPMSQRYGDCECGDLSAAGQHVCDNCMAGFKAGIVPGGHIMISAEEYDFLRQQASKGAA